MFRKPPIRTYEGKKGSAHRLATTMSGMTREDIPPDIGLQPKEYKEFHDTDESMDYDPFDTTFDRLARDAKVPPLPPDDASNSSYKDSSSDASPGGKLDSSDEDPPAILFDNPEPRKMTKIVKKRRNNKRQKLLNHEMSITTNRLTRQTNDRKRLEAISRFNDENTEPNMKVAETENSKEKKKSSRKKAARTKFPVVDKKMTKVLSGVKKRKNLDDSRAMKRCSVSLKRFSISLEKPMTSGNREISQSEKNRPEKIVEASKEEKSSDNQLNDDPTEVSIDPVVKSVPGNRKSIQRKKNHQNKTFEASKQEESSENQMNDDLTEVSSDLVVESMPGTRKSLQGKKNRQDHSVKSSKEEKSRQGQLNGDLSEVPNDSVIQSSIVESSITNEKRITKNGKNLVVSLPRLNVAHLRVRNFSSSTPMGKSLTKTKSLLRLSPITIDLSEEIEDHDENSIVPSLPKKSVIQDFEPTPSTSKDSTPPQYSIGNTNRNKLDGSAQRLLRILSDSPDSDPSSLMFNDTATMMQRSPSLSPQKNLRNVIDQSTNSSITGFGRESSDHESFHLIYEVDNDLPSPDISVHTEIDLTADPEIDQTVEPEIDQIPSRETSNENCLDSMINSTTDPFMGFSKSQKKNEKKAREKSQKFDDDDDDEWSTISGSLNEMGEKSLGKMEKKVELVSSRENSLSDDISDFVDANSNVTGKMETNERESMQYEMNERSRVEMRNLTKVGKSIEERKKQSIELLSSREDSLNEDISDFVDANENLFSKMKTSSDENMQIVRDESSKVESYELTKTEKSVDVRKVKEFTKNDRPSLRPIVLLDRLKVPLNKIANSESFIEMTRRENISNTLDSISQLSMDETTSNLVVSSRDSIESSSKQSEMEIGNNFEESRAEMESLKVNKMSENTIESEKLVILDEHKNNSNEDSSRLENYENDFIKESSRLEKLSITREATRMSVEKSAIEKLSKSDNFTELSETSRSEKSEKMKIFEKHDTHDDSIQPVVLLTRLNDPFRITKRRKKYHNFDLQLSAITENHTVKTTKAIQEDEDHESSDKITNKSEINGIKNDLKMKMTDESSRVSTQMIISQDTTVSYRSSIFSGQMNESTRDDKVVFLKPGKSWARSLSILSQVHSQDDLESLAVGKGKKWRESVQNLLEMQQQGLIQSCVKKNEDDKERSFSGLRNSGTSLWVPGSSQPDTSKLFGATSPGRFVRRVSIRVVPDGKSFDRIKDTSFLEAYGITQTENRKTLAERRTLIAPRQTLVYNVKHDNPGLGTISKSLNTAKSRDVVLTQCGQDTSLPFEECYPQEYLKKCRKIGEGVYGEVFLYQNETERNVIKIIPIEGEMKVNGERQKKFDEILSEIVIAKELHNLRFADKCNTSSFVEVKNIRCVKGKYPDILIDLWNDYDEEKQSENDSPSIFEGHQLYIVLELGHAGEDLEAFVFQNATESHALFMQTALALAVAEESLEFEHRDLHWGNVLISRTDSAQIDFKLQDKPIRVASKGVKVSVIDFTLSRMSYQGCSIFNDLSMDEDLFVAQGEYQFDIYRLMRQKIENNWQTFEPYTNILWLHYILDKMITAVRYKRKSTKIHKAGIVKLQELKNEILEYSSAVDFVTNCDRAKRLQGSRSSVFTIESTN